MSTNCSLQVRIHCVDDCRCNHNNHPVIRNNILYLRQQHNINSNPKNYENVLFLGEWRRQYLTQYDTYKQVDRCFIFCILYWLTYSISLLLLYTSIKFENITQQIPHTKFSMKPDKFKKYIIALFIALMTFSNEKKSKD